MVLRLQGFGYQKIFESMREFQSPCGEMVLRLVMKTNEELIEELVSVPLRGNGLATIHHDREDGDLHKASFSPLAGKWSCDPLGKP